MAKFKLGRLVATAAVADRMKTDYTFNHFVDASLNRFQEGDWGEVSREDKAQFDENMRIGTGLLQGVYTEPTTQTVIWLITEWDHHATTILFPHEW